MVLRQQRAAADDPDAGLVAARLDAEHQGFLRSVHAPRRTLPPAGSGRIGAPPSLRRRPAGRWPRRPAREVEAASRRRRRRRAGSSAGRRPTSAKPSEAYSAWATGLSARTSRNTSRDAAARMPRRAAPRAARGLGPGRARPRRSRWSGCRHPSPRAARAARRSRRGARPPRRRRTRPCGEASSSRIIASDQASVGNEARSSAMIASRSSGVARRACGHVPTRFGPAASVTSGERR